MNELPKGGGKFTLKANFHRDVRRVDINKIVPLRVLKSQTFSSSKFRQIKASIEEMGLVEPPVVKSTGRGDRRYFLIDGHLRIACLQRMGVTRVDCLVTDDDDTYTYNKRINRLSTVQDYRMIAKAVEKGVTPERVAKSLGLSVETVKLRMKLLDGICPEAIAVLADATCPTRSFNLLRQMKPIRQIESAELMVGQKNCSVPFVQALLAATAADQLSERSKRPGKRSAASIAKLEREIASLQMQITKAEDSYGPDVLHLTVVRSYLTQLLGNAVVVNWLAAHNPEFLREFQRISTMDDLTASVS